MDRMKKAGRQDVLRLGRRREQGRAALLPCPGPDFLIEYDNTQNNANHIHSVWRDLTGDFGEDLLKEHYAATHSKGDHNH